MNMPVLQRRHFIQGSAALGAGLSIGLTLPGLAQAQDAKAASAAEVGVWVLIRPNDKVIIRIARSEMGQGTLTGLAGYASGDFGTRGGSTIEQQYVKNYQLLVVAQTDAE